MSVFLSVGRFNDAIQIFHLTKRILFSVPTSCSSLKGLIETLTLDTQL